MWNRLPEFLQEILLILALIGLMGILALITKIIPIIWLSSVILAIFGSPFLALLARNSLLKRLRLSPNYRLKRLKKARNRFGYLLLITAVLASISGDVLLEGIADRYIGDYWTEWETAEYRYYEDDVLVWHMNNPIIDFIFNWFELIICVLAGISFCVIYSKFSRDIGPLELEQRQQRSRAPEDFG